MNKVVKGAGILAIFALISKLIGALYRIPLTNIIGAEGMGLYQMVFPLYTVLLTISSGGLPVALSRVVASKVARGDESGAKQVLVVSLISLSIIGAVATVVVISLRGFIASLQGNSLAQIPYLAIAPSLTFVAVISCFRGYYQGKQNMLPSAFSGLVEQVVKLFAGLFLASLLLPYGTEYATAGALLGVTISELVAMVVLIGQYKIVEYKRNRRQKSIRLMTEAGLDNAIEIQEIQSSYSGKSILKEIYRIALPVTLGSLVMPLTQVIDSVLVINILRSSGINSVDATSLYGLMTGPIFSLVNMPSVIMLSVSIALLPTIAQNQSSGKSISDNVSQALKYNFLFGLLCSLIFIVYANDILTLLYSGGLSQEQIAIGTQLLQVGGISILYVSILQVATSVLQGLNHADKPAINLLFGAIVKITLTILLLPFLGIMGAMIASVSCYFIICFLDVLALRKMVSIKLNALQFLVFPLIAGGGFVGMGLLVKTVLNPLYSGIVAVIIAFVLSLLTYLVILLLLKVIRLNDLENLKRVKKSVSKDIKIDKT